MYGFDDDDENISRAVSDFESYEELSQEDHVYEEYLADSLEKEGSLLLRRRFGDLVTEYMRENGSPGFDLEKCYYSLRFVAGITTGTFGEYSLMRDYAYDAKM